MIEKSINFINQSFEYIQKKFLNLMLFLLEMFRNKTSGFFQFLFERNIVFIAVGFVVSSQISKLMTSFVSIFIDPIVNRLSVGNVQKLKDLEIKIFDTNIKIGLFLDTIFNFIITLLIIYQIWVFSNNSSNFMKWLRKAENDVKEQIKIKSNIVIAV